MIKYKILELKLYDFSIKDLEKHKNLVNKNLIPPWLRSPGIYTILTEILT